MDPKRVGEREGRSVVCHGKRPADSLTARALELPPEALLLHPHCSIKPHRGTDAPWSYVANRFFLISPQRSSPIKRDISSPPISPNVGTVASAIRVDSTNCRHALRCIPVGLQAPLELDEVEVIRIIRKLDPFQIDDFEDCWIVWIS